MRDDDVQRHESGIVKHLVWYAYYIAIHKSMDVGTMPWIIFFIILSKNNLDYLEIGNS